MWQVSTSYPLYNARLGQAAVRKLAAGLGLGRQEKTLYFSGLAPRLVPPHLGQYWLSGINASCHGFVEGGGIIAIPGRTEPVVDWRDCLSLPVERFLLQRYGCSYLDHRCSTG